MKHVIAALMIVMLLIGSLAFITPFVANTMRDFSDYRGWLVQDKDGKWLSDVVYSADKGNNHLDHFYNLINSPWRPSQAKLVLLALALGLVFAVYSVATKQKHTLKDWFYHTVLPVQLFCVLVLIGAVFMDNWYFWVVVKLAQYPGVTGGYVMYQLFVSIVFRAVELFVADMAVLIAALGLCDLAALIVNRYAFGPLHTAGLADGQQSITINCDGQVRIVQTAPSSSWWPGVRVIRETNLATLFGYLLGEKTAALAEVQEGLVDAGAANNHGPAKNVAEGLKQQIGASLKEAGDKLVDAWATKSGTSAAVSTVESAEAVLQGVTAQVLGKHRAETVGHLKNAYLTMLRAAYRQLSDLARSIDPANTNLSLEDFTIPGIRYVRNAADVTVLVIEQQPQLRSVFFDHDFVCTYTSLLQNPLRREEFYLSFPYIIFVVTLYGNGSTRLHAFCRTEPLASVDDELYLPGLPNVQTYGEVCMGTYRPSPGSRRQMVEDAITSFWSSTFNCDLPENLKGFLDKNPGMSLVEWERQSEADGQCALRFSYIKAVSTLADVINAVLGEASQAKVDRMAKDLIEASTKSVEAEMVRLMEAVPVEGRYGKAILDELVLHLDELAEEIALEAAAKLELLGGAEGVSQQLDEELTRAISECIRNEFAAVSGRAIIRPQADVAQLFTRMRGEIE